MRVPGNCASRWSGLSGTGTGVFMHDVHEGCLDTEKTYRWWPEPYGTLMHPILRVPYVAEALPAMRPTKDG